MSVTPTADDDIFKARREHRSILALARSIRSADNDTKGNDVVAAVATYDDEPVQKPTQVYIGRMDSREEWVHANKLVIPEEYQRDYSPAWAKEIAKKFDVHLLTKIHVNRRPDGTVVVIDGQHRISALRIRFGDDADMRVLCEVHNIATIEEEAKLFLAMNHYVRKTDAKATFRGRLAANEPEAVQLRDIASEFGYTIANRGSRWADGQLPVAPLLTIRRQHDRMSFSVVRETLSIIRDIYGDETSGIPSPIILGIGSFIATYRDNPNFDRKRLLYSMEREGIGKLLRSVKDIRAALRTSDMTAGRKVILYVYNHHLQTRRLPDV